MKPVGIITDSCSGISQKEASERGIFVLPMPFYIEGHCLYEGVDLDRDEFLEKLKEGPRPGGDASAPYGSGRAGAGGKGVYG